MHPQMLGELDGMAFPINRDRIRPTLIPSLICPTFLHSLIFHPFQPNDRWRQFLFQDALIR